MLLLFFDISGGELLIILAAVFLVFGPKKVPEIARQIGKGMNELKKATSDITREFQEGANQAQKEVNQVKNTIEVSNQRMNQDFVSGPSEFKEDPSEPPAGDKLSVPEGNTEPPQDSPEGSNPGEVKKQ